MKLHADIAQVRAVDIAALLPMLKTPPNTAAGKLVQALVQMPKDQLCNFLNAFSSEDLLDLLSIAAAEYEKKFLSALEKIAKNFGFPMKITGLSINKKGRICLQIGRIDYPAIVSNYHPSILTGMVSIIPDYPLLRALFYALSLSLKAGLTVLARIPAKTLDTLAVGLINRNADKLLENLNSMLAEKNFSLRLGNPQAEE